MLALPFLSENEIWPMFNRLQRKAPVSLQPFTEYVASNWISGTTWSPSDWTVFKKAVRTNNDIEGWHHGLNRQASGRGQLPLYLLLQLLHKEAKLIALQIRLVSAGNSKGSNSVNTATSRPNCSTCGTNTRPMNGQPSSS